jgi:branched-chain amino acid transport system substrate-binding protein
MFKPRVKSVLIFVLIVGMLALNSCAPAAPATQAPAATTAPQAPTTKLPEKIIVGAIEPLTGPNAVFGTEGKLGIEMAVQHINEMGGVKSMGGIKLEVVSADSGETADSAKLATEDIVSKYHPAAIFGAYIEGPTIGIDDVAEREKILVFGDALADNMVEVGRKYLFRPAPTATKHGAAAMQFVIDAAKKANVPIKTVSIANEDSAFGVLTTQGANDTAVANGLTVLSHQGYPFDVTDATALIGNINNEVPDIVIHAPYFTDAILFAKTFSELGKYPLFIAGTGACGYTDPESIKSLGALANYYSNTYSYNPAKDTPQNKKFVADFKAKVGHIPTEAAGMNYYAVMIFYEGLEAAGRLHPDNPLDPETLRQVVQDLDLTSGVAVDVYPGDRIQFDEKRDNPYVRATVLQVLNGEPKVVWPFEDAEAEAVFPRPDANY